MKTATITVVQVIRDMGYKPHKKLTWPVGQAVARRWRKEEKQDTKPGRTPKTNEDAAGNHQHCHYPLDWRAKIEEEVHRHLNGDPRQTRLLP